MTEPGLVRSSRVMAVGTAASRITGFGKAAVITAAIGTGAFSEAYNIANVLPNIVYELLLGGILTSVVVPLLVRAAAEDGDEGTAYAQRLLTLVLVVLGGATALVVAAAPLVVGLYASGSGAQYDTTVLFSRLLLPEIVFYGLGAVMGAVLQTRGRFGPPVWAPVLNNVAVMGTAAVFVALPGPARLDPATATRTQVLVLGIGTTLGIVAQTAALLPALRATGFRWRLRFDLRGAGLGEMGRLGAWVLLYVAVAQAGYSVVVRLAASAGQAAGTEGYGFPPYVLGFTLFQLPHAVVAVSVITALLPRMSRAAVDDRLDLLRADLARGVRLVALVLVPAAAGYLVLGREVAVVVFAHGVASVGDAEVIGRVLAAFAVGLLPFSAYQLQQRVFYALRDTRTPALLSMAVTALLVATDLVLVAVLPARWQVVGLAAGYSTAYVGGFALSCLVLTRRVGGLDLGATLAAVLRLVVAAAAGGVAALGVARLVGAALGTGPAGSLVSLAAGGVVLLVGYLGGALLLRVPEAVALRRDGPRAALRLR